MSSFFKTRNALSQYIIIYLFLFFLILFYKQKVKTNNYSFGMYLKKKKGKVCVQAQSSGPSGQSLSQFLYLEATSSISTPPLIEGTVA